MERPPEGYTDRNGEFHEGILVVVKKTRKNSFHNGWVAMGQDAMMALAKSNLGLVARKVLDYLLAKVDMDNRIFVRQAVIAAELDLHRSNVSTAIRNLLDEGVIRKLENFPVGSYYLNPSYGWKGLTKHHQKAIMDYQRAS